jgi:hypothetical protein
MLGRRERKERERGMRRGLGFGVFGPGEGLLAKCLGLYAKRCLGV